MARYSNKKIIRKDEELVKPLFTLGTEVRLKAEHVSEVSSFLGNEELFISDIIKVLCPISDTTEKMLIRVDGYYCDQSYFEEVPW